MAQLPDIYNNCEIYGTCAEPPTVITFNNNTGGVNISDFLDTVSFGPINDFNITQFIASNFVISIDETYLESLGDGEWLNLSGGNANQNIDIGMFDFSASNITANGKHLKVIDTITDGQIDLELSASSSSRVNWGRSDNPDEFMEMGAFSSINNIDTKNRNFRIFGDAGTMVLIDRLTGLWDFDDNNLTTTGNVTMDFLGVGTNDLKNIIGFGGPAQKDRAWFVDESGESGKIGTVVIGGDGYGAIQFVKWGPSGLVSLGSDFGQVASGKLFFVNRVSNQGIFFQVNDGGDTGDARLFLMGSEDRVGIMTELPQESLDVNGTSIFRDDMVIEGKLNVSQNATFQQDVIIEGTLFGGSPVKIAGINITNDLFDLKDNLNSSLRFMITNDNSGTNASASISAVNDVGGRMSIGVGSSNFMLGSINYQNITVLLSRSQGKMIFANFFNQPFTWLYNPQDDDDANNLIELMKLDGTGLNITGNITANNYTANGFLSLEHQDSPAGRTGYVQLYSKNSNQIFITRPDGTERRLLDGGGGSFTIDEKITFQNVTIFSMINYTKAEDTSLILNMFFNNNNTLDSSIYNNDGINNGTRINQTEAEFNGVDNFININESLNNLATTKTGTWMAWVKPVDATPSEIKIIISFSDTNANEFIHLRIKTSGEFLVKTTDSGTSQWQLETDDIVFSDNTWTHVTLVQDGISPILYIDGVMVAQTFTTSTDKTSWFNDLTGLDNGRIGGRNVNSGGETNPFDGIIDEVKIYDRALSSNEVKRKFIETDKNNFKIENLYANTIIIGSSSSPQNITMFSPDGTSFTCGVTNVGSFICT